MADAAFPLGGYPGGEDQARALIARLELLRPVDTGGTIAWLLDPGQPDFDWLPGHRLRAANRTQIDPITNFGDCVALAAASATASL